VRTDSRRRPGHASMCATGSPPRPARDRRRVPRLGEDAGGRGGVAAALSRSRRRGGPRASGRSGEPWNALGSAQPRNRAPRRDALAHGRAVRAGARPVAPRAEQVGDAAWTRRGTAGPSRTT
jgi:hypothetical protein